MQSDHVGAQGRLELQRAHALRGDVSLVALGVENAALVEKRGVGEDQLVDGVFADGQAHAVDLEID